MNLWKGGGKGGDIHPVSTDEISSAHGTRQNGGTLRILQMFKIQP